MDGWKTVGQEAYRYSKNAYVPNEIQAQENKFLEFGAVNFVPPWDWRKGKRLATLEEAPRKCTIKGNISSKGKNLSCPWGCILQQNKDK